MKLKHHQRPHKTYEPSWFWLFIAMVIGLLLSGCESSSTNPEPVSETPSTVTGATQTLQTNQTCQVCHERQFQETIQSVKSGYRAISPAFNSLELAGNFLAQAALEAGAIRNNLRPVYGENGENMVSAVEYDNPDEARAAFCIGCHDGGIILLGENGEPEVPEWEGLYDPAPPDADNPPASHPVIRNVRPLRDYHFIDSSGNQVLSDVPGGPPPAGARPSLGSQGVLCDHCHNVQGAAFQRSFLGDGFANSAQQLEFTRIKVGPFDNSLPVGPLPDGSDSNQNFHSSSSNPDRIN